MPSEVIYLEGHVIDSLTLSKVLDLLTSYGCDYEIQEAHIGHQRDETSRFQISVSAPSPELLEQALEEAVQHGAIYYKGDAKLAEAPADGVYPEDFYSTTNLETWARVGGQWIEVEKLEMDCGVRVFDDNRRAECAPFSRVKKGDLFVVGHDGLRVAPPERRDPTTVFAFMGSDVSSEKPKEKIVRGVAEAIRNAKEEGRRVLLVGGPAIVHTGAAGFLEELINKGWIDVLFAGNALAAHDIEAAMFGTSLGVHLDLGSPVTHGHQHHLRAINRVRGAGSIAEAVRQGIIPTGVMRACVLNHVEFVLAGSIRDDGPLPDVITDVIEAQDAMRAKVDGLGVAVMVATTLHSVATGNILPATVQTFCVDTDADTVIKLSDRGTHQQVGIVTDCHFFMKELATYLKDGWNG